MVTTNRLTKQQIHTPRYTQSRPYHQIDYISLCQNISNDPLIVDILNDPDVDSIAKKIIDLISFHLEQYAPLKTIQVRKKNNQTKSYETKQLILQRDQAWEQYLETSSIETLREHRRLKTRVTKQLIADRCQAQIKTNQEAVSSKGKWKNAKEQLGWIQHGGPRMLIKNGLPITSPQLMADELNQRYIVSAAKTRQQIPKNRGDPMINFQKLVNDKDLNLAFQPVRKHELYQIISQINPTKSSALDGISMKLLNKIKNPLMDVLLHLVNSTITQSKYPSPLKKN